MESIATAAQPVHFQEVNPPSEAAQLFGLPKNLPEFRAWEKPVDGFKYEWVNGKVIKTERGMNKNQLFIADNIARKFAQTTAHQKGGFLAWEADLELENEDDRRPDLCYLTLAQKIAAAKNIEVTPSFAIEIISKSEKYDEAIEKLESYFEAGVKVVWHVFPKRNLVIVYRKDGQTEVCKGDAVCSAAPALPEFEISVEEVFYLPDFASA